MKLEDLRPDDVKGIIIAAVVDSGEVNTGDWNVHLINTNEVPIENVMITAKGYGELDNEIRETSTIRWFFERVEPKSFMMIEPIMDEVFGLTNEYYVSFFMDGKLYDKKYIFLPETINEQYTTRIPIMEERGVMVQ